jgi:ADP-ribose pyrophosphatase
LSKEVVLSNPYYDFCHDSYALPSGTGVGDYFYIDIPGSTMIIPSVSRERIVLVKQYRYLLSRVSLEFPAGGIKRGENALSTAQAELREETGYRASAWKEIGQFAPCNGLSNELCHVYWATELIAEAANPEPTEEMEVIVLELSELRRRVGRGEIWDGMTIAALHLYECYLEEGR